MIAVSYCAAGYFSWWLMVKNGGEMANLTAEHLDPYHRDNHHSVPCVLQTVVNRVFLGQRVIGAGMFSLSSDPESRRPLSFRPACEPYKKDSFMLAEASNSLKEPRNRAIEPRNKQLYGLFL